LSVPQTLTRPGPLDSARGWLKEIIKRKICCNPGGQGPEGKLRTRFVAPKTRGHGSFKERA